MREPLDDQPDDPDPRPRNDNEKIDAVHKIVGYHLACIAQVLDEYLLTLTARHPDRPEAYIIVGDDYDISAVIDTLHDARSCCAVRAPRAH